MNSSELPKTYDPAAVEPEAYRVWMEEKCFHAEPAEPGDPYCIVIPPPNVTGALHLGHAINNTLQDILIRKHRMAGYNTLWMPGIDHAGIATQAVVEKQLKEKENKTRHDVGRDGLVERIWAWKEQYGNRIVEQLKRMGCSCDWDRTRFTLDDVCARAVRETFFKLFRDGLIYRGKRLVNWDVFLQTSVSDDEIYHETVKTSLWHIRYPIAGAGHAPPSAASDAGPAKKHGDAMMEGTGSRHGADAAEPSASASAPARPVYMVVATTRPETMLGDTAVAVHPDDPRWNWAIGKHVRLPLADRLIPIIADPILVDPKFGTGVVKVTPAHDPNDYAVWQRHKGQPDEIDILNIITPDGKINENGGKYAGLPREKARKQVVTDLEHQGLLEKEEPYETQIGHSDRSKTPIEPYLSDQWFVRMAPLAEPALEVVCNGTIRFFPERHAQQYLSWLGEKRDWPISRQLWWGHRIPVWRLSSPPADAVEAIRKAADKSDEVAWMLSEASGELLVCLRGGPEESSWRQRLEHLGLAQDPDVLDTWFSSALWPHSTLGWPEETAALSKWYPTSVLLTGRDIITLWVARMVMMGIYNRGHGEFLASDEQQAQSKIKNRELKVENAIPFLHVAINPTILDGKGERMSKSKGNGVDPVDIIENHGADAMRFTLTTMATETQDARLPVKKLPNGRNTSEKFDIGRNFCNKIWNATRFALQNLATIPAEPVDEASWSIVDRWILSRLMRTIQECDHALAEYRFDIYAKACYDFFWRDLCDWYIEAVKLELKDGPRRGQVANVLAASLDSALRLMHPIIPFITETIWWRLNELRPERGIPGRIEAPAGHRLIRSAWPVFNDALTSEGAEFVFTKLQELVVAIRNLRNEYKVDPRKTVNVSILAPGDAARQIEANRPVIELLATCSIAQARADLAPPPNSARAVAAGCEVFVEGLVDADAEKQRLEKRREELNRQVAALRGRLANPSYASKAPANLVQQTRDQLAEAEAELAKLGG